MKNLTSKIFLLTTFIVFISSSMIFSQSYSNKILNRVDRNIGAYYEQPYDLSINNSGIVTVNGTAQTLFDKLKIGELISEIKGVKGIDNEIQIQTSPESNDIIRDNIIQNLKLNNVILEPENIKVDVNNGVVHLSGTVSYYKEKLMAQSIASWQKGVTGMTSDIKILSPVKAQSDENIKTIIKDILSRYFNIEKDVHFTVTDGEVNIYGAVSNLYAKDHIEKDINHILGVKSILNQLKVKSYEE